MADKYSTVESGPRVSKDYVRFIVLCAARTGSYMLTSSLNSSPNIVCFGELFNPIVPHVDYRVAGYVMADPEERKLRDRDFKEFLDRRIFCERPDDIGAVGFKTPHNQFFAVPDLLQWLVQESNIRVLHLRRRNPLRQMVSTYIADATGAWVEPPAPTLARARNRAAVLNAIQHPRQAMRRLRKALFPKEPAWKSSRTAIVLTEYECRDFFAKDALDTVHYGELFSEHDIHTLYYEELVDHYDATLEGVQTFLGLAPRSLTPMTRQQNPEPLRELIANYDELYQAFAGTAAAAYFECSDCEE